MSSPGEGKLRVLTWNLEWARVGSWRAEPIRERLRSEAADVAVLTEAQIDFARELYPYVVDVGPHPRARQPGGSKVVIASPHPLDIVDLVGSSDLPPHNFAAVDAHTPVGTVRVVGVVVRWKEKRAYIDALPDALARVADERTIVAGDFNLSMLRDTRLEHDLRAVLSEVGLAVATAADWPELKGETPLIDHIALASGFTADDLRVWPRRVEGHDRRISDHAGVSLAVRAGADR